jgi:hypothetical protein
MIKWLRRFFCRHHFEHRLFTNKSIEELWKKDELEIFCTVLFCDKCGKIEEVK